MSAKVYFIADLHIGHESMSKKRGFSSVLEHDEYIKSKWGSVVRKGDSVYILGDLTMEKNNYEFLNKFKTF